MPYVNIPESKITGAIAKQVGDLQGQLGDKVQDLVTDAIQKVRREACPSLPQTQRLSNRINAVTSNISGIERRVSKFSRLAKTIRDLIKAIEVILAIIKKLPIPQSVPPGFGLPVAFSMIQADLLHAAKEKIKQGKDDADGIIAIMQTPQANLSMYSRLLGRVSTVVNGCRLEGILRREVNEGRLREQTLRDLNIINADGEYIFSNIGVNLFDGLTFDNSGNITEYTNFNENQQDRGQLEKDANSQLLGSLDKLNGSGEISDDVKENIKGFLDTLTTTPDAERATSADSFYTAPNGEIYKLEIKVDPKSPAIAPRRFAVAIDKTGVEILKGPKSFSSSTKILLDELKFRIDNQLS